MLEQIFIKSFENFLNEEFDLFENTSEIIRYRPELHKDLKVVGKNASTSEIKQVEKELHIKFPSDYLLLMTKYKCSGQESNESIISNKTKDFFDHFISIKDISEYQKELDITIPKNVVVFGDSSEGHVYWAFDYRYGNNPTVICLQDEHINKIHYSSFTEFYNDLKIHKMNESDEYDNMFNEKFNGKGFGVGMGALAVGSAGALGFHAIQNKKRRKKIEILKHKLKNSTGEQKERIKEEIQNLETKIKNAGNL